MTIKQFCILIFLYFKFIPVFSQNDYTKKIALTEYDSLPKNELLIEKYKFLKTNGAKNILILLAESGKILFIYKQNDKLQGIVTKIEQRRKKRFISIRLTSEDKKNYETCVSLDTKNVKSQYQNCDSSAHAFQVVHYVSVTDQSIVNVHFTSDCYQALKLDNLGCVYLLFRKLMYGN